MVMPVPMMQVRVVRVPMHQADVPVPMSVRLTERVSRTMIVPVMLVVTMPVLMLHRLVKVFVLVSLGQVQPEA